MSRLVTRETQRKLEASILRVSSAFSSWGAISAARALPASLTAPPELVHVSSLSPVTRSLLSPPLVPSP